MNADYWKAAELVMGFLREEGRSKNTIGSYRRGIARLAEHLDAGGLEFTPGNVVDWLERGRDVWPRGILGENSGAANRMIEALEDGVAGVRPYRAEGPRGHRRLSGWSQAAVEGFAERARVGQGEEKARLCGRFATQFMLAAGLEDARPEDLTAEVIVGYLSACGDGAAKGTRALRLTHLRQLLSYLHERGDVPAWAPMLASDWFAEHMGCYGALCEWGPDGIEPDEFLGRAEEFVAAMRNAGYSVSSHYGAAKALRMLYVALALNGARYSRHNARAWLEAASDLLGGRAQPYGRALAMFERFLETGAVDPSASPRPYQRSTLPEWAKGAFDEYADLRRREGIAEKTVAGDGSAVARLAAFAEARGVRSWGGLDAETIVAWCSGDPHLTSAGRANYVKCVRGFLRFLEDEGVLPAGASLAAHVELVLPRRVPEVLGDAEIEAAERARLSATTPMELRDAAMVALGLTMGMRACDVVGLRVSDISWRDSSVSFVQRKTLVPLELPLTVQAGNAIVAYLRDGRPRSPSPTLFVSHVAPFGPVTPHVCAMAMRRTFGNGLGRFHTLRRTFATRMLEAGAGRSDVTDALGHTGSRTSEPYLSLDAARMRLCALSPSELGVGVPS